MQFIPFNIAIGVEFAADCLRVEEADESSRWPYDVKKERHSWEYPIIFMSNGIFYMIDIKI